MTSVIAVPETGSAAKDKPGGMQAVRVCVCVCLRGVPIWVIDRLVVGSALRWTNDCNQQELCAGGARLPCLPLLSPCENTSGPPFDQPSSHVTPPWFAAISTSPAHNLQLCLGLCFIEPRKPQVRNHLAQLAPSRVAQTHRLYQNSPRKQTCTER